MPENKKVFIVEKDNLMFVIIFGLWVIALLNFNPKILAYAQREFYLFPKISIILFTICVNIFWLFGIYHITIAFFSTFFSHEHNIVNNLSANKKPKTAILYLTMNDFREEAVYSCMNQDYENFDLYILDDSTEIIWKNKIDQFIRKNKKARLIRRNQRINYKAGNLNHALGKIGKAYEYFAVADADGILPKDFLKKLIPFFSLDQKIGFVQANQKWNENQNSPFAIDLGMNTDIHWRYYVPAKNQYGFVMFYGHGAIIKTDVWTQVGGFPDTITEDIAFSSFAREKGYKGVFVPDVVCLEDFPADFRAFIKRNERWVKGTTEYLIKWYHRLLFSKKVTWVEKIDILISAGVLLQPFLFIAFLFVITVLLPLSSNFFGLHIPLIATFAPIEVVKSTFWQGINIRSNWSIDFFLIMAITAFAQFLPLLINLIKKPLKTIQYFGGFSFACLGVTVPTFINMLTALIRQKHGFIVTGAKNKQFTIEEGIIVFSQIAMGSFLIYSVIGTGNVWLFTVISAFFITPIATYTLKWENPILNILVYIPFVLTILIVMFISFVLTGS